MLHIITSSNCTFMELKYINGCYRFAETAF